jgi:hypothetical protein
MREYPLAAETQRRALKMAHGNSDSPVPGANLRLPEKMDDSAEDLPGNWQGRSAGRPVQLRLHAFTSEEGSTSQRGLTAGHGSLNRQLEIRYND